MRLLLAALAVVFIAADPAAQVAWTKQNPASSPSPRLGHALVYASNPGFVLLVGGAEATSVRNDTWLYSGSGWHLVPGSGPGPRWWHKMVFDSARGRVVLFGGWDATMNELGDTWEWDGISWKQRILVVSPPARAFHHMSYDSLRRVTVLYGGQAGTRLFDDTWEWNGNSWVERKPPRTPGRGSAMVRKSYRDMCFDESLGRAVLVGGNQVTGSIGSIFAETWEWDGNTWISVATPSWEGGGPYFLAYDGPRQRLVSSGLFNYERVGQSWTKRGGTGVAGVIAYDSGRHVTVLFTDMDSQGVLTGETWEYGPVNPAHYSTYGAGCLGTGGLPSLAPTPQNWPYLGDAFTLDVTGLPSSGPVFAYLGASRTQWHGYTLPLALGSFGLPGCTLLAAPDAVVPAPRVPGGASLSVPIPTSTALVGKRVYGQIMAIDPPANPAGAVLSDAVEATIGSK